MKGLAVVLIGLLVLAWGVSGLTKREPDGDEKWATMSTNDKRQAWANRCIAIAGASREDGVDGDSIRACTDSAFRLFPK